MEINVQKLYTLTGHKDCVYNLETGTSDNIFYSAAGDGMVVEWDLKNPETGKQIVRMKNSVYALHFLEGPQCLVIGQNFEGIHIISTDKYCEQGSLLVSNTQIFDIKSYGEHIYIGSGDGTLYIVDFSSRSFIKKIKLSDKSVRCIAVNEKLGEMALGISDNTIRILDLKDYSQKYRINALD